MIPIDQFIGGYHFLSNFYMCNVEFEGLLYKSSEHAFQAAKSTDPDVRKLVASKETPKQAKRSGRGLKLRDDWDYIKDAVMEEIVRDKFNRNEDLKHLLIETGDRLLVEGNYWSDCYWGVDLKTKKGKNKLGQILMKIRKELRSTPPSTNRQDRPTERLQAIKPKVIRIKPDQKSMLDGLSS